MNYLDSRTLIKSGDLIFIEHANTVFGRFVSWWTKSPYSHCAIAWVVQGRVMVVEQHLGGQRIVNLGSYMTNNHMTNRSIDVLFSPVPWDFYGEELLSKSGSIPYSIGDFINIGFKERLGATIKDAKGEVCSEMVARVLKDNGLKLKSILVSPGQLFRDLRGLGVQVKVTIND